MSESNGTVPGSPGTVEAPVNRVKRRKASASGISTGDYYTQMREKCKTKALAFKASDAEGTVTLTVKSFPEYTEESIAEASAAGVSTSFKPKDRIAGKAGTAKGTAEGEEAIELTRGFFAIESTESE